MSLFPEISGKSFPKGCANKVHPFFNSALARPHLSCFREKATSGLGFFKQAFVESGAYFWPIHATGFVIADLAAWLSMPSALGTGEGGSRLH